MRRRIVICALLFATAARADTVLERIASGLDTPVAITHAGDSRLFITLQKGLVVIHDGTSVLPTPFLDLRTTVSSGGERGLLSVAFHPDYAQNGRFFVYYTNRSGDITIARYNRSAANANLADAASGVVLLTIPHPTNSNHNGGQLQFGSDGYLYIGTGDGGSAGDPPNNAQNLASRLGKMLRIDVDSGATYTVPSSNPFRAQPGAQPEIWAYGLRNPWRFSFDRDTGDLWIADVGQGLWEEVDLQPVTSIGGENYGWRRMEGSHCFNPATNCGEPGMVLPVIEYPHSPECSITGGYRYRGTRSPALRGRYIYGDLCSGKIWGAALIGNTWNVALLRDTTFTITTFGEDSSGEVYVADVNDGSIYRIVDTTQATARRRTVRK
jgi:glucose/arabinose dehydrogenase